MILVCLKSVLPFHMRISINALISKRFSMSTTSYYAQNCQRLLPIFGQKTNENNNAILKRGLSHRKISLTQLLFSGLSLFFALDLILLTCRIQITFLTVREIMGTMIERGNFRMTQARRGNIHFTLCRLRRMTTFPQIATTPTL